MCHTETMECILQLDPLSINGISTDNESNASFGFTLQGPSFSSDVLIQPPIIGYLEPGGVAERYRIESKATSCVPCYFKKVFEILDNHFEIVLSSIMIIQFFNLDLVYFKQVIVFLR